MTHGEMIAYLQDTANAPESAGVDNEIFGEMVKHFTKLQEENEFNHTDDLGIDFEMPDYDEDNVQEEEEEEVEDTTINLDDI